MQAKVSWLHVFCFAMLSKYTPETDVYKRHLDKSMLFHIISHISTISDKLLHSFNLLEHKC